MFLVCKITLKFVYVQNELLHVSAKNVTTFNLYFNVPNLFVLYP